MLNSAPGLLPRPRAVLWGGGASKEEIARSLDELIRDAGHWSGVDVFSEEDCGRAWCAYSGLTVRWHIGRGGGSWADSPELIVPEGVPVAWVAAGTRTSPGWVLQLLAELQAHPEVGSCSPLAVGDALFTPLVDGQIHDLHLSGLNAWLMEHAPETLLDLGRPLLQAGLMRHEAWQAVQRAPRLHWALAIARAGWVHGTSQRVCVKLELPVAPAQGMQRNSAPSMSLLADESLWRSTHPLTGLRHSLSTTPESDWRAGYAGAALDAASTSGSVRLHVMHSWGGGLNKWVREFCESDAKAGTGRGLLLKSIGTYGAFAQRLELYVDHDEGAPLRVWELRLPIHATALSHLEVAQILEEIIEHYGVDEVVVSSLIGHSLDVLRTGLPTALVMHDHYPFCVTLYAQFEGECRQCDSQRLQRCMRHNAGHRFFRGVDADDWLALREAFVATVMRHRPLLAAPSRSVALRWQSLMPELREYPLEVIEHGLDMEPAPTFEPPEGGPLRVVVLGRLSAEKGRELLAEILPALAPWAQVLLLGCGEQSDEIKQLEHVTSIDHFDTQDLGAHLARWRPHVGLLTSIVPETFSYALSELWHYGVPVLACDLGALGDRIRDGENGFLEPAQVPALLARLRRLNGDRATLAAVRERLLAQSTRSVAEMLDDYAKALRAIGRTRPVKVDAPAQPLAVSKPAVKRSDARWLHVSPEATWIQAARAFMAYTRHKAANSPRLPQALRQWLRV